MRRAQKNDALPSPFQFWSPTQIFSPFGNHVSMTTWTVGFVLYPSMFQFILLCPYSHYLISGLSSALVYLVASQVSVHPTSDLAPLTVSATFAKVKTSNQDHHMQLCRLRSACDSVTIC